jgi:hypothetical protein
MKDDRVEAKRFELFQQLGLLLWSDDVWPVDEALRLFGRGSGHL